MKIKEVFFKYKYWFIGGAVVLVITSGILVVGTIFAIQSFISSKENIDSISNSVDDLYNYNNNESSSEQEDDSYIKISSVECEMTDTQEYVNGYDETYKIIAKGTVKGPEGAAFDVSSNPSQAGEEYRQIDCGSWSSFTQGEYYFDCIRSSTDQSTSWTATFEYTETYLDGDYDPGSFIFSVTAGLHPDKNDYYGNLFKSAYLDTTCVGK